MNISIDSNNIVTIGGYKLEDEDPIFEQEGWKVRDTESELQNLKDLIGCLKDNNFDMCLSDINRLNEVTDHYIFASTNTNNMLSKSDDLEEFEMVYDSFLETIKDRNECFMCGDCEEWFEEVDDKFRCKECGKRE